MNEITNELCHITNLEQLINITTKCEELGINLAYSINGHTNATYFIKAVVLEMECVIIKIDNNLLYRIPAYDGLPYETYIDHNPIFL